MNKLKTMKLKLYAVISVLLVVGVIAVISGVKAYQSYGDAPKVVVEGDYIEAPVTTVDALDEVLGASTSDYAYRTLMDVNGDRTYHITQSFIDASTTIISIPNPFLVVSSTNGGFPVLRTDGTTEYNGATSTVDFVRLNITSAATTSYSIVCGASAAKADPPSIHLLGSGTVNTSSLAYIENNLTVGADVSGSSTPKILMTPKYPYFNCLVTVTGGADGEAITQASNTFDGYATVRFGKSF